MFKRFAVYKVYLRYAIVVEKGYQMTRAVKRLELVFEQNIEKRWREYVAILVKRMKNGEFFNATPHSLLHFLWSRVLSLDFKRYAIHT